MSTYEMLSSRKAKRGYSQLLAQYRLAEICVKRTAMEYGASYRLVAAIERMRKFEEAYMKITTR